MKTHLESASFTSAVVTTILLAASCTSGSAISTDSYLLTGANTKSICEEYRDSDTTTSGGTATVRTGWYTDSKVESVSRQKQPNGYYPTYPANYGWTYNYNYGDQTEIAGSVVYETTTVISDTTVGHLDDSGEVVTRVNEGSSSCYGRLSLNVPCAWTNKYTWTATDCEPICTESADSGTVNVNLYAFQGTESSTNVDNSTWESSDETTCDEGYSDFDGSISYQLSTSQGVVLAPGSEAGFGNWQHVPTTLLGYPCSEFPIGDDSVWVGLSLQNSPGPKVPSITTPFDNSFSVPGQTRESYGEYTSQLEYLVWWN